MVEDEIDDGLLVVGGDRGDETVMVLDGQTMDQAADSLLDLVVATASGQETKAERNGEREIAIWKSGVTL